MQNNSVGGSKNIPLTAEGIIRHMKGNIPQKCRNIFLFLQCETIGNDVDDEVLDAGEALNLVGAGVGEEEEGE